MSKTEIICILGMHRSGTSLLARIVNLLGVHLGPSERLLEPQADNPKGFWEYRPFMEINDEILRRLGGDWYDIPNPGRFSKLQPDLEDLASKASQLIERDFAGASLWGWKDPRTCITLPFWKKLLPGMKYILCFRNPADVARSLESRHQLPRSSSSQVWLEHVGESLLHTQGEPHLMLFYEDLLEDVEHETVRLQRFIGTAGSLGEKDVADIRSSIDKELRHHRTSLHDTLTESGISPQTKSLYLAMRLLVDLQRASTTPSARLAEEEAAVLLQCQQARADTRFGRPAWLPKIVHRGIRKLFSRTSK